MDNKWYKAALGLLWLALPAIALQYWQVWDQLPVRLATHFDATGRANGWMTREASLTFTLVLAGFFLILATAILIHMRHADSGAWALLGLFYVIVGFLYRISGAILDYNLTGQSVQLSSIVVVPLAILVVAAVFLRSKRGAELSASTLIAEETHAEPRWSLVFILPLVIELGAIAMVPNASLRIALGLVAVVLGSAAAMAWSGFQYLFTTSGVEIRTLGFRLRSIPIEQIQQYTVERWNPIGGYGIRGIGERRAYVWGNRGVRIKTSSGEVFLGHKEPERLVRDLDMIRK